MERKSVIHKWVMPYTVCYLKFSSTAIRRSMSCIDHKFTSSYLTWLMMLIRLTDTLTVPLIHLNFVHSCNSTPNCLLDLVLSYWDLRQSFSVRSSILLQITSSPSSCFSSAFTMKTVTSSFCSSWRHACKVVVVGFF